MDKNGAKQAIIEIAKAVHHRQGRITRADLAYELADYGIQGDSMALSQLVYECYQEHPKERALKAIVCNSSDLPVVEAYKTSEYAMSGNVEGLECLAKDHRSSSEGEVKRLLALIEGLSDQKKFSASITSRLVGTSGVEQVQSEASHVMEKYSEVIACYEDAKDSVVQVASDFVVFRTLVLELYQEYANLLIDVFGERVKSIAPELFDFSTIEFLDVEGMSRKVTLAYESLSERCGMLMGEITDSFKLALGRALGANNAVAADKRLGLMVAGINMLSHYIDASSKSTQLNTQLVELKRLVQRDMAIIKGDMLRLKGIYDTIDKLYIPRADVFFRFSKEVFTHDFEQLLSAIYAAPQAQSLRGERTAILTEVKRLSLAKLDTKSNINYFEENIQELQNLLKDVEPHYKQAQACMPSKPFVLLNILTLGGSGRKYQRNLYEWTNQYSSIVKQYESLAVDLRISETDLAQHKQSLVALETELAPLQKRMESLNEELRKLVVADVDTKANVLKSLGDIVSLLHTAKEIASAKLDGTMLSTYKLAEVEHQESLFSLSSKQVTSFLRENPDLLAIAPDVSEASLDIISEPELIPKGEVMTAELLAQRNEELLQVAGMQAEVLQSTISLVEDIADLIEQKRKLKIEQVQYDEALAKIQIEYTLLAQKIEDKEGYQGSLIERIKSVRSLEERRAYLLLLGDSKASGLDKLEDFLNGDTELTI